MHSEHERRLRRQKIEELHDEIKMLRKCIAVGGHPEDIDSYRHELSITLNELARLEDKV